MEVEQLLSELQQDNITLFLAGQVFLVVFIALIADLVQKRLIERVRPRVERTPSLWDDALLFAVRPPLTALIWLAGISFAADIVGQHTGAAIFEAVAPLRAVGMISVITWALIRFIQGVEANILRWKGDEYDPTTVEAVGKLLRISVVITGVLMALQTLGFSISGVLAFGGVGGIAVGFAAKDMLANFFGGLMLYLDRPFAIGDWVRSPDRNIEGTVETIGWRLTVIRTFDKRPLYVPNSTFSNIAVENPSRMHNRRIFETVGIRYDDAGKMADIVADVRRMLEEHPEIDTGQTLIVNFNGFAPSSLDFFVYTFTKTTQWTKYHEVKQDVLLKIVTIIESHGAQIAFPTSTVHVPEGLAFRGEEGAQAKVGGRSTLERV
ncbi:mechanosensitive ion channel family protein [Thiohalomonas denitrificans]|uniref:MscS family membrane protein n=1 Tax=Thiohalomonas denitrificans TaxID=415747 RepID=A0A1G5QE27_9GAMM|nr:mechanosensitive ion channel family protein [Thiohalomonas denitrificans]SCZ59591.1 MscS family membrane protein [Thiohalomonas denitrificans]